MGGTLSWVGLFAVVLGAEVWTPQVAMRVRGVGGVVPSPEGARDAGPSRR